MNIVANQLQSKSQEQKIIIDKIETGILITKMEEYQTENIDAMENMMSLMVKMQDRLEEIENLP